MDNEKVWEAPKMSESRQYFFDELNELGELLKSIESRRRALIDKYCETDDAIRYMVDMPGCAPGFMVNYDRLKPYDP